MKSISFWAKYHPRTAQALIVMIYLLMNVVGLTAGRLLMETGVLFSRRIEEIALAFILILTLLYRKKASYLYRKTMDFSLAITTFILICYLGNQGSVHSNSFLFSSNRVLGNTYQKTTTANDNTQQLHSKKKNHKKEFRKTIRQTHKQHRDRNKEWIKTIQIVLVVLTGIGLGILLGALACNISCSGSEALAILVAVVGYAGLFVGGYFLIRKILSTPLEQKSTKETEVYEEK